MTPAPFAGAGSGRGSGSGATSNALVNVTVVPFAPIVAMADRASCAGAPLTETVVASAPPASVSRTLHSVPTGMPMPISLLPPPAGRRNVASWPSDTTDPQSTL